MTSVSLLYPRWIRDLLEFIGPVILTKSRLQEWSQKDLPYDA